MVKPQNILSERDRINDNVVEAVAYGALNFKPANTSTKGLDYILQSLLGYSATELRNGGVTNSSKAGLYLFRNCGSIGDLRVPY